MARGIIVQSHCDWCDAMGLQGVVATERHTIGIDGDEPKALDFCRRCEMILEPLIRLIKERGQDLEPPKRHKEKRAARQQPEATPLPEPEPEAPEPEAEAKVLCPTHGSMVGYGNRNSHADNVHHKSKPWEIAWEDPEGALTAFCTAHQVCIDNNYGFTGSRGLAHHIRLAPLEIIDD